MQGFLSYAHHDHAQFEAFRPHVSALKRAFPFNVWTDHAIRAGADWETKIAQAIADAQVFILLLSPAFIDSDYVFDKEIPAIKKRHRTDNVLVLPVLVARCAWEVVIKRPQVLPTQNRRVKPITDWSPHSHGFNQARAEMHDAIASHFNIKPRRARL